MYIQSGGVRTAITAVMLPGITLIAHTVYIHWVSYTVLTQTAAILPRVHGFPDSQTVLCSQSTTVTTEHTASL